MSEICTSGLWVDKRTGRVVDSQPVEGHLLVSPGGRFTPEVRTAVDRAQRSAPPEVTADPTVEATPEPVKPATDPADGKPGDEEKASASGDRETASRKPATETMASTGRTGRRRG